MQNLTEKQTIAECKRLLIERAENDNKWAEKFKAESPRILKEMDEEFVKYLKVSVFKEIFIECWGKLQRKIAKKLQPLLKM